VRQRDESMRFSLAESLRGIVHPAVLVFHGLTVVDREPRLDRPLAEAERKVRSAPPTERDAVRAMYRAVGLDPTRRRPSSEALLRRVARRESLPRVNSLVDVCNWCSLELQLPYGVYDLAHVVGDIQLRLGNVGEEYAGIGKDTVHVEGRLTLADGLGPFGNPSSDSARTMVTSATTAAVVVVYSPHLLLPFDRAGALELTARRILEFVGGREVDRFVV
jgi:DNA/RNA-binding domain of Phe-tRNA-synthetase-like protein